MSGGAASAHDEAAAERIAMAALSVLDLPTEIVLLQGKGKWIEETTLVATLIRKRTGVKNRWIAERLGMGHEGNVTRALRRVKENPIRQTNLSRLEAMLVSRD